jgi:signal transduction histidine kinase
MKWNNVRTLWRIPRSSQNAAIPFQLRTLHKNGYYIWIEGTVTNLLHNESVKAFVLNYRDITARKKVDEALIKNNAELKKTNSELDRFVYSTSHDLRAPLSSILGLVKLLRGDELDRIQIERIEMVKQSILKLDNFIEDILHYSRNARLEIAKDDIEFVKIMQDVRTSHKYMDGTALINLNVGIEQEEKFVSDKRRLAIVLNNLISNAVKYRDTTKQNPFVRVHIQSDSEKATIVVEDNGIGIAEKEKEKIFEMFYRASKQSSGSGLGLYILKETAEKLRASISLESKKDIGSKFTIIIPNLLNHESKEYSAN